MKKIIEWLWMKYVATGKEIIAVFGERLRVAEEKTRKHHECLTSDCKH